jgi:hypothetical protein
VSHANLVRVIGYKPEDCNVPNFIMTCEDPLGDDEHQADETSQWWFASLLVGLGLKCQDD